ncbi:single-stranded DNA-binding protein, partial [Propionibacterium freudenreichii]|nr:single-stranded DNA-binding protein [Propionibacterium freudenreichii]
GNAGGGQPYGGGQQQAPQGNQGMAGGGQQGGNQGPVSDPWASAQSDEPPF